MTEAQTQWIGPRGNGTGPAVKVAIVTPSHRDPSAAYVGSLAALLLNAGSLTPGVALNFFLGQGHLLVARNKLTTRALDWGADYLLLIDDDMGFPPNTLAALLAHGKTVVGCNYTTRDNPPRPTACLRRGGKFERVFTKPGDTGLEEVSHMGLGVCLIAAAPLRQLAPPIFQALPGDDVGGPGEDRYLFERLREAGETVWLDHGLSNHIQHWGSFPISNQVAAQVFDAQVAAHRAGTSKP